MEHRQHSGVVVNCLPVVAQEESPGFETPHTWLCVEFYVGLIGDYKFCCRCKNKHAWLFFFLC